jgi:hypothetical protein
MSTDCLNGWKDIADHLKVSTRTAHRWEREFGMPVHRVPGSRSHLVFAVPQELSEWRLSRGALPADELANNRNGGQSVDIGGDLDRPVGRPSRWRRIAAAGGVVVLAACVWALQDGRLPASSARLGSRLPTTTRPRVEAESRSGKNVPLRLLAGPDFRSRFEVRTRDGDMVTVTVDDQHSLGLLCSVKRDQVEVLVVLLGEPGRPARGVARQVGALTLRAKTPVRLEQAPLPLLVEWVGDQPLEMLGAPQPGRPDECTVACDRVRVTAVIVRAACGTCCAPGTCLPGSGVAPEREERPASEAP